MTGKSPAETELEEARRKLAMTEFHEMPGGRAALPAGSLPKPFVGPQGDEQRDPPTGSPAPVIPAPVIDDELPPPPTGVRSPRDSKT
jgi:hypothetical protein